MSTLSSTRTRCDSLQAPPTVASRRAQLTEAAPSQTMPLPPHCITGGVSDLLCRMGQHRAARTSVIPVEEKYEEEHGVGH